MGLGELLKEHLEPPEESGIDQDAIDRLIEDEIDRYIEREIEELKRYERNHINERH